MITIKYTDGSTRIIIPDKSFYQTTIGLVNGKERASTPADKVNQIALDSGKAYSAQLFYNGNIIHKVIFPNNIPPAIPAETRSKDEILAEIENEKMLKKHLKSEFKKKNTVSPV